jgi:cardiolipin synthase
MNSPSFSLSLGPSWFWVSFGTAMHALAFVLIAYHCLMRRRDPRSTLLWIFLAGSFPLAGPVLYLFFGIDRVPMKGLERVAIDHALRRRLSTKPGDHASLPYWRFVRQMHPVEATGPLGRELDHAIHAVLPEHHLLGGNAIEPLLSGAEAYPRMFEAIRGARHHIHVQCFLIRPDVIGRRLMDLLMQKAHEGVEVRLLYDRFGSTCAHFAGLFRIRGKLPTLRVAGWTQANPLKRQFQINLRNHRKTLIVDGSTAFCGGINFHADNIHAGPGTPIRDYHFMVQGPIVQELQYTFVGDWHYMTGEDAGPLLGEAYFPKPGEAGRAKIRIINSGPSRDANVLSDVIFAALVTARRQILAVTPYFVPPVDLVHALRAAAQRGVDVRLVVPQRSNHVYAGLAGRALYAELLEAGVRIYSRRPPFSHAKALILDDEAAMVGTANLDARSLWLNYETNLVVYDDAFINRLKQIVLDDVAHSEELDLTAWNTRPRSFRFVENLAYLMLPVL